MRETEHVKDFSRIPDGMLPHLHANLDPWIKSPYGTTEGMLQVALGMKDLTLLRPSRRMTACNGIFPRN